MTAPRLTSDLRGFSDRELAFLARRLEALAASLRDPTSAAGAALLRGYQDRLDAVRAEVERRATV